MLGKNCPRARGSGSFLTNGIKTLLFVVKRLLIKSQARITLMEIFKSHFWNSITVMVVVVLLFVYTAF